MGILIHSDAALDTRHRNTQKCPRTLPQRESEQKFSDATEAAVTAAAKTTPKAPTGKITLEPAAVAEPIVPG